MNGDSYMDEHELIGQMNRNQRIMHRIDNLFLAAGFLCVLINGAVSIYEMLLIPIHLNDSNTLPLLECFLAPISAVFSVLSSCKKEKWTAAALAVFLIRVLLIMISKESILAGAPCLLLFALPQFLCLRQYEKLMILKNQFGYPSFNSEIYMHKPKRHFSGAEFASRTNRRKKARGSERMDDITPPPVSGDYEDISTNRRKPL